MRAEAAGLAGCAGFYVRTGCWSAELSTFEASRDSNHIISTTNSTREMATTASQYSAFHKIPMRVQA